MAKLDPEVLAHLEWLGFVQPTGLVVSAPALARAGANLQRNDTETQRRLRESVVEWTRALFPHAGTLVQLFRLVELGVAQPRRVRPQQPDATRPGGIRIERLGEVIGVGAVDAEVEGL